MVLENLIVESSRAALSGGHGCKVQDSSCRLELELEIMKERGGVCTTLKSRVERVCAGRCSKNEQCSVHLQ
jgi:hypothetical protein